jgi:hypothetical protein
LIASHQGRPCESGFRWAYGTFRKSAGSQVFRREYPIIGFHTKKESVLHSSISAMIFVVNVVAQTDR